MSRSVLASALPEHVRALLAPGILAPPHLPVELVQTHISFVLLAGDRVYKLKKPRNLGFLDYSTLDLRRRACEAEVTLNQRLTHGVYLGVKPVVRRGDIYALSGEGEIVDYAVVMRRLPANQMMDRLVDQDAVSPAMLAGLARHLATFYESAATDETINTYGTPETLLTNWQENFLQTLPYVGRTIGAGAYLRIARAVYADLLRLGPVWRERIAAGRIRDCHGDLRLSAVCFDDGVQVYDCIEFNDRFRFADIAADVAFLTMDLDGHGRPDLADEFLAQFITASGDQTLPVVLPFYRCYRAYVRGKVDSFQLDEPEVPPTQRRAARRAGRRRFRLAESYVRAQRHRLALVTGTDQVGGGALAAALAGRLGAMLVDPDRTDAGATAAARLRRSIPVVLGPGSGREAPALAHELAARFRLRPLVVVCGAGEAPPGSIILSPDRPLRETLAALHRHLALAARVQL